MVESISFNLHRSYSSPQTERSAPQPVVLVFDDLLCRMLPLSLFLTNIQQFLVDSVHERHVVRLGATKPEDYSRGVSSMHFEASPSLGRCKLLGRLISGQGF